MLSLLLNLLVGWPAIVVTLILAIVGLLRNNYRFLLGAAILAFPFSWFISGFPSIRSLWFLLPLFLFGSSYLMSRGREMLAWLAAIPYFLSILLLFFVILMQ
jgi:hypothetical protein